MVLTSADPAAAFTVRSGTVEDFDAQRGAGEILDHDGGHRWPFHCTRIADGSRTIEVGARVTFRPLPGPCGLEAMAVQVPPSSSAFSAVTGSSSAD